MAGDRLYLPWLAFAAACVLWMLALPAGEVIPFHLIWITFALVYGFEPWPVRRTLVTLAAVAGASGAVMVRAARMGTISWDETAEIGLMVLLALLVMGHVRRRETALAQVTHLAEHEVGAARQRERLARLTSHEMRTPLTIATGYVDLLLADEDDAARRADLVVVRDELGRLARAGDRLLRMIRLRDPLVRVPVDVGALVEETVQRWGTVADRRWSVEAEHARVLASAERLRASLDTLIENAVRHTGPADSVRVTCARTGDGLLLGVADSGPGLTVEQARAVNGVAPGDTGDGGARGAGGVGGEPEPDDLEHRGTGFGLGIVREIVRARGGVLRAGTSREGGALLVISLPVQTRATGGPPLLGRFVGPGLPAE